MVGSRPSAFEFVPPIFEDDDGSQDWATIGRRLRRHLDFLALAAVAHSVERDGMRREDLLDIASEAVPDADTKLLTIVRLVGLDKNGERVVEDDDPIEVALTELQSALDDYRLAYQSAKEES